MDILSGFIHTLTIADLPRPVLHQAKRCLLDTLGVALAGRATDLSAIIHEFSVATFQGRGASLWLDGREVTLPGAVLANGMTIDSFDAHDGQVLTKGHAGAAIIPCALAMLSQPWDQQAGIVGEELLLSIVIGYEIALRCGIVLHATACDYHTSGAWNAVGSAALASRRLGLDAAKTNHALGIAEYLAPRSQMMRCIEHPTMLKDGSGWGAMTGLSAAQLARSGFTGAPAVTVLSAEHRDIWQSLGSTWYILEQYFKPHAVCRWAQPAIEGAQNLKRLHGFDPEKIKRIVVETFHEAVCLDQPFPQSTEEAQYSLPFPLAAILLYDSLGIKELSGPALADKRILALSGRVEVREDPEMSHSFPARRLARVLIVMDTNDWYDSGTIQAGWEADSPPSDQELSRKFFRLVQDRIAPLRAEELHRTVWESDGLDVAHALASLLYPPGI